MIDFKIKLTPVLVLMPGLCAGAIFTGILIFIYLYYRSRKSVHLAMMLLGISAFIFIISEMCILSIGGWLQQRGVALQFHRLEQVAAASFIFTVPYMMHNLLELSPGLKKLSRIVYIAGMALSAMFIIAAFAVPDLYVSMSIPRPQYLVYAADYGRGQEGPLYALRDLFLGLVIIYSFTFMIVDLVKHRNFNSLLSPLLGLMIAIASAIVDMVRVYSGVFIDFTPDTDYSRFAVGITLFIIMSMVSITRQFVDLAVAGESALDRANREAERSRRQNDFIKNVLHDSSAGLYKSTEIISSGIVGFSENTKDQAASNEEASATIEEITAGMERIAASASDQNRNLSDLVGTMQGLTALIRQMSEEVGKAFSMSGAVSRKAVSGSESLKRMDESMNNISQSSQEMTGIIAIINDISDRINLLSLNAAIEAARAGDAGRGFAVVADEISKLADQTASSIKDIGKLIHRNDQEITNGSRTVSGTVETINSIITDINSIMELITKISDYMNEELKAGEIADRNVVDVQRMAQEIAAAMNEQKMAVDDVSNSIAYINELAQNNASKIEGMADSSKALLSSVESLNKDIENYEG